MATVAQRSAALIIDHMLRLPQNLSTGLSRSDGPSPLETEIMAEKAASLGRAGKRVERALTVLIETAGQGSEDGLIMEAADAVYSLIVQRELCGLHGSDLVFKDYDVPPAVIAKLGARRP
jgi:hypothetical protein